MKENTSWKSSSLSNSHLLSCMSHNTDNCDQKRRKTVKQLSPDLDASHRTVFSTIPLLLIGNFLALCPTQDPFHRITVKDITRMTVSLELPWKRARLGNADHSRRVISCPLYFTTERIITKGDAKLWDDYLPTFMLADSSQLQISLCTNKFLLEIW